jgi:hypothetical protein
VGPIGSLPNTIRRHLPAPRLRQAGSRLKNLLRYGRRENDFDCKPGEVKDYLERLGGGVAIKLRIEQRS